jgi:micrococcal nuclease
LAFALLLSLIGIGLAEPQEKAIVVGIIDGDTLVVKYQGKEQKVRIIGMDTPEVSYNWKTKSDMKKSGKDLKTIIAQGKQASNFVRKLVKKGDLVSLEFDLQKMEPPKDDKPARLLAYVYLSDGRMLNEVIVKEGYRQVYTVPPNVKYVERFRKAERGAREKRKGLWE